MPLVGVNPTSAVFSPSILLEEYADLLGDAEVADLTLLLPTPPYILLFPEVELEEEFCDVPGLLLELLTGLGVSSALSDRKNVFRCPETVLKLMKMNFISYALTPFRQHHYFNIYYTV
jgi:hypothetical protein